MTYRVSNGVAESELIRVSIFVTRRPAPAPRPVATPPPPPVAQAPFLTARATPRLDRRRRTLVRLSCDQTCSLTVRLEARLRSSKRTLKGTAVKRSIARAHGAGRAVAAAVEAARERCARSGSPAACATRPATCGR